MLLRREAVQFVRPCVCLAGGITGTLKVAAAAEGFDVQVVPHNPLGAVSTAACVQIAASIPNFAIQEYRAIESNSPAGQMVEEPLELSGGFLVVPETPGIGVSLSAGIADRFPYRRHKPMKTQLHIDGSVVDR
jgi:galactonate dehydratase